MKRDKKTIIKEGRLSGFYKDSMVEFLVREIIKKTPDLTRTQMQRLFSHAYQTLRESKGGDKIVMNARSIAKKELEMRK